MSPAAAFLDPGPAPTRWAGATDAAVLCGLADRDEDALRELHRRYARAVYALVLTSGATNLENVAQQVFLTLMRRANHQANSRLDARTWILGTTYQLLLQVSKDRGRGALSGGREGA